VLVVVAAVATVSIDRLDFSRRESVRDSKAFLNRSKLCPMNTRTPMDHTQPCLEMRSARL
jgi:hypothetical protein